MPSDLKHHQTYVDMRFRKGFTTCVMIHRASFNWGKAVNDYWKNKYLLIDENTGKLSKATLKQLNKMKYLRRIDDQ